MTTASTDKRWHKAQVVDINPEKGLVRTPPSLPLPYPPSSLLSPKLPPSPLPGSHFRFHHTAALGGGPPVSFEHQKRNLPLPNIHAYGFLCRIPPS